MLMLSNHINAAVRDSRYQKNRSAFLAMSRTQTSVGGCLPATKPDSQQIRVYSIATQSDEEVETYSESEF